MLSQANEHLLNKALNNGWYTYIELNSMLGNYNGESWEHAIGIPVKRFAHDFIILSCYTKDKGEFVELVSQSIHEREVRRILTPYPIAEALKQSMNKTINAMITVAGIDSTYLSEHENIYQKLFGFSEENVKTSALIKNKDNVKKDRINLKQTGTFVKK